jgi:ADP-ribose pyrophosphatase YjhB (NUDIX family)
MGSDHWLVWVRSLRAISQTGLHFSRDPFDTERYRAVGEIAIQMLEQGSSMGRDAILALNAGDLGYATPKVDVRGACFRDGRILLVQETADHGRWTLPGGWADPNETPGEAVAREIAEESGYQVTVRKLIGVFDREKQGHRPPYPFHVYKLLFLCEIVGGSPRESIETGRSEFFPEDALPELSRARITDQLIHACFRHCQGPTLPTEFD